MNNGSTARILIVEDAQEIQELLSRLLISAGYQVSRASNGREALTVLNKLERVPELILLDLMMPEMDGFEFRKEQEKDVRFASIPVIAMTAYEDVQTKALLIGAKGFLKKPFSDIETILSAVRRFAG